MKKDELKVGYLVRHRNGELAMVMPIKFNMNPIGLISSKGHWCSLRQFADDLTFEGSYRENDIMEVWGLNNYIAYTLSVSTNGRELLWKREEKVKLTMAEIEKRLGYEFEIVNEGR